jgi:hypothetical protein
VVNWLLTVFLLVDTITLEGHRTSVVRVEGLRLSFGTLLILVAAIKQKLPTSQNWHKGKSLPLVKPFLDRKICTWIVKMIPCK